MTADVDQLKLQFESRHGAIEKFLLQGAQFAAAQTDMAALANTSLYEIQDWSSTLAQAGMAKDLSGEVGTWMNMVLGTEFTAPEA
jgi:hypothetical protein